jgi:hypothetical protein
MASATPILLPAPCFPLTTFRIRRYVTPTRNPFRIRRYETQGEGVGSYCQYPTSKRGLCVPTPSSGIPSPSERQVNSQL